jgi:TolB protein
MSNRAVYGTSNDYDIWVMDADGTDPRKLTDHFGSDSQPDLSPDGKRIAWVRWAQSGSHVMVMDSDGGNQRQITQYAGDYNYPRWSPDMSRILFTGGHRIFTVKPEGTDLRKVFEDPAIPVRGASWSPDGKRVVADTNNSSATAQGLWVIDLSTGSASRIFTSEAISPAWSPNGDRIAFNAGPGFSHIFTIKPDGTAAAQLTTGPGQDQGGPARFDPAWSPDGSRLAFMYSQPNYEIYSMAADGSDVRNLSTSPADDQQATF